MDGRNVGGGTVTPDCSQPRSSERLVPPSEPLPHEGLARKRAIGGARELLVLISGGRVSQRTCGSAQRVNAVAVLKDCLARNRRRRISGETGGFQGRAPGAEPQRVRLMGRPQTTILRPSSPCIRGLSLGRQNATQGRAGCPQELDQLVVAVFFPCILRLAALGRRECILHDLGDERLR